MGKMIGLCLIVNFQFFSICGGVPLLFYGIVFSFIEVFGVGRTLLLVEVCYCCDPVVFNADVGMLNHDPKKELKPRSRPVNCRW